MSEGINEPPRSVPMTSFSPWHSLCTQQAPNKCVGPGCGVTSHAPSPICLVPGLQNVAQIHPLHAWYRHGFLRSTEEFTLASPLLSSLSFPRAQSPERCITFSLPIWALSPCHAWILLSSVVFDLTLVSTWVWTACGWWLAEGWGFASLKCCRVCVCVCTWLLGLSHV